MPRLQLLSTLSPEGLTPAVKALPHVLLVVDGFPKVLGGGERIVLRLAEQLPRYGYRASILTFRIASECEFDPRTAPCPLYHLPLTSTYGLDAMRGALALKGFLRDENVRIVETFFESSDLWAGLITHFFSRAKLVWSRRDMGILRGAKHRLAYRRMRSLPDAVIAVSRKVADHVTYQDGVLSSKVHVVHNGLDLPGLDTPAQLASRSDSVRTVTTIGNIRRVKGHDVLVQAAFQVRASHPSTSFTIAGASLDTAYFQELSREVNRLGLSGTFTFLGKISNLSRHLSASDIFVLPSRSEGFSNALIEAMALGMPVVATDVGGNSEAVQDGVNGLLIPPEDPAALADAIGRLLSDADLARRFGDRARQTVQMHFTTDAMMRRVAGLFDSLLLA